jgi:hypothetical protein
MLRTFALVFKALVRQADKNEAAGAADAAWQKLRRT